MPKHRSTRGCGPTPLGAVVRGLMAGAAGTAAMDLFRYAQYRSGGASQPLLAWELSGVRRWDEAPAPAQVGKRVYEALYETELPDEAANRVNNLVHWGYGLAWGAAFGVLGGSARRVRLRWGPVLGTVVWLLDYVTLPPTGLYQPIWEYDRSTLAKDWAVHVAYGVGATAMSRLLTPRQG